MVLDLKQHPSKGCQWDPPIQGMDIDPLGFLLGVFVGVSEYLSRVVRRPLPKSIPKICQTVAGASILPLAPSLVGSGGHS